MRVAVVGGTGSVGAPLVAELAERGDEVRALSRRAPAELPPGASHHAIDLTTGDGIADALAGVEAVVDAANDSSRGAKDVLVEGGARLLAAESAADVRHHVAISIVGCDRVPISYYGAKVAQEKVVTDGPVPWSLLRATQFHTLIAMLFAGVERFRVSPTGRARLQPIDPIIVAKRLADVVHDGPGGRLPDLAGPEIQTLTDLARAYRQHSRRRLLPVHLPLLGGAGKALRAAALCDPDAATPGPTFEEWLTT